MSVVTVEDAFCGFADRAQGGYVAGLLAAALGWNADIFLRSPPPLATPFDRRPHGEGHALFAGETLIAEGRHASPEIGIPSSPPGFAEAEAASQRYVGFHSHTANVCFVCGPRHDRGRSLGVFPGWIDDMGLVASPWVPPPWTADEEGLARGEIVWAVLDCPGWVALARESVRPIVTGRMTAGILRRPKAAEPCVVAAWPILEDGRKLIAGTALFGEDGDVCAACESTWLLVDPETAEDPK